MYQAIVFLPLLAAIVAGLFGRVIGLRPSQIVTTGAVAVSCALSWVAFFEVALGGNATTVTVLPWVHSGALQFDWALRIDTLTAVMLVVVTSVSALVHLYSWGYMSEDPHQPRFFAYLSLFTFAMLMLVTADNLVQMFFGWEGVGLASYLLIGFWYQKPSANAAAMKAFVVNRVGDFGFMLGMFATFMVFDAVGFDAIFGAAPSMAGKTFSFLGYNVDVMTTICLLLFVGAMGKSAQLGLHTWLPDAMEGPTPVSALIHAATMVTAGVFMVARCSPLFEQAPVALEVVTVVGAATALFAATIGTTQNDIKRVIAYSTCSQLGYMFFALGVGAYGAAMFHLFTHAFFKALLFLGAGSVIHSMHHEQDMRYYGGLYKAIPFTYAMMVIGTLALTGFPYTAGYFSKDAIIEAAYASGSTVGMFAFVCGVFAAFLTSFYSWRLAFLTFHGKPRWAGSEHIQHAMHGDHGHGEETDHPVEGEEGAGHGEDARHVEGTAGYHPHESPLVMLVPLAVLAVGAVAAGFVFRDFFIGHGYEHFWNGALTVVGENVLHQMHEPGVLPAWVPWSPSVAMLLGFLLALNSYVINTHIPAAFARTFKGLYIFLYRKWFFDELYNLVFVRPAQWLGRVLWKKGDGAIIDGLGPDGISAAVATVAVKSRRIQTGYVFTYAFAMLIGVAAAVSWFLPKLFSE
ncbi:NADH-quinone oxidoreductase subunit L [Pedomonas mirosovicensis]|uniref:NADH-quinone oxidoreductase subunit L n=1 Tax=Pedomonas mirosovicensis TaxID=2908641 RepID=UPI0021675901|nr:NADH-quinone oxidoreductase subunit L [Pedomonas mirosovicensis]MCH8685346.1 NADH-quinone oxidoreductase subunit L [Pedomonas mirosovicensis]